MGGTGMRAKVLAMAGGILLLAIVSMFVLSVSRSDSSTIQRLPDGSWLKIVSLSYAATNFFYSMPHPKPWQSFLLKHLPSSWSAHLGLWHGTGGVGTPVRDGRTNLAVVTVCKQAVPTSLCSSAQMDVFDEQDRKVGTAFAGAAAANSDGPHRRRLVCWTVDSNIPQNTKKLVLRFSELTADGKTRQQVAEFVIPNPATRKKEHD